MYKSCLGCIFVGLFAASAFAQSHTVTAPSGGANPIASGNDFATQQLQNPWDMSQRNDPGYWLNGNDFPSHGWQATSFANGVFTGTVNADPNLWLLETGSPALPPNIGKTGDHYPINANVYRIFSIRMCVPSPAYMMFFWSTKTIYDPPGMQASNVVLTTTGCRIYIVDLAQLGGSGEQWNGIKRSLRFDPAPDNQAAGSQVQIDWARLVDLQPSLLRNITWSGGGAVNIYLDNDNNAGNGNLGLLAQNQGNNSYSLNVGALEPGNYYVAIQSTSGGSFAYSSGFYQVNAPATINILAPSEEGSTDDFATSQLNDPWDMASASDIEQTVNVTNGGLYTINNVEDEAGTPLGNIAAWYGISTDGDHNPAPCAAYAKPAVYPLFRTKRGALYHIDPNRYRILTVELGLPDKARDLCGGSIIRVVWHVAGQPAETYSYGIAINSRAGANVNARLNFDMSTLLIDPGGPSQAGWAPGSSPFPGIESFRIDPHEFASPTGFFIKRIKLAALERVKGSYNITWALSKASPVNVYYDTDKDPSSKTLIGSVNSGTLGSLNWNVSGLATGSVYYVYVETNDGYNVNGTYSKWPVIIDPNAPTARIVVNRSLLNFGVSAGTVKTPPQLLRLSFQGAPAGQPCWNAVPDLNFMSVTPSSGCGAATLTVALANQSYGGSTDYSGPIRITSAGAFNSPQLVQTVVRVRPTTGPPTGTIDTPANGAVVSGSIGVTGWAVDDVGISRVAVCRSPVGGEAGHPFCGPGQVYLGDAVFIDDARPDVFGVTPTTPFNYRAGWGFLVLTNMLPNQGNGNFTIFATAWDLEGFATGLGSKVITVNNASATEPFGNIDTPFQGETIGGLVANYGWVLSRVRRADPPGGGVVRVFVDGVDVGSPSGWTARPDITAAFPGYPGIGTAMAGFSLNAGVLANGLHTIMWLVTDNGGVTSGVGSRFFNVFNTGSSITETAMRPSGPDIGRRMADAALKTSADPVLMRTGFNLTTPTKPVAPGFGGARHVRATERDRVEIRLSPPTRFARDYAGYLVVDGVLRELPIGSSFDPDRGVFYWQPGLAFTGAYDFLFVRTNADGTRERIPVRVTLEPRDPARFALSREPWRVSF
jgi:hypothetical protein